MEGEPPKKKSRFFSNGDSKNRAVAASKMFGQEESVHHTPLPSDSTHSKKLSGLKASLHPIIPFSHHDRSTTSPHTQPSSGLVTPTADALDKLNVKEERSKGVYGQGGLHNLNENTQSSQFSAVASVDYPNGQPGIQHGMPETQTSGTCRPLPFGFPTPPYSVSHLRIQPATSQANTSSVAPAATSQSHHNILSAPPNYDFGSHNPSALPRSRSHAPQPNQTIDLDRDSYGNLLSPSSLLPQPPQPVSHLPPSFYHPNQIPFQSRRVTPPNHLTSPNRLQNAILHTHTLKRKRAPILPPPSYIYTRQNDPTFTVFHGLLLYPELCFYLASLLPLDDLLSLYAISRDFHTIIDTRFTTTILSQSLRKAPESSRIFPFRCYARLCRRDPTLEAMRGLHPDPRQRNNGSGMPMKRMVPGFKWLRFVLYREKVVDDIMRLMAEAGVPLPKACARAIKKMWFLMDIPDNARRIGVVHNREVVSDMDLFLMVCVVVKLDMRFNDPTAPEKRDGMRKMALGMRSLVWLKDVLAQKGVKTWGELLKGWVEHKFELDEGDLQRLNEWREDAAPRSHSRCESLKVFGVEVERLGSLQHQGWGKSKRQKDSSGRVIPLLRPDQLVMREAVRRGLRFGSGRHWLRCLLYGYVSPETLGDMPVREMTRLECENDVKGWEREGLGKDELLDLKPRRRIAERCIRSIFGSQSAEEMRREESDLMDKFYEELAS